jgi:hypothetical protein
MVPATTHDISDFKQWSECDKFEDVVHLTRVLVPCLISESGFFGFVGRAGCCRILLSGRLLPRFDYQHSALP